MAKENVSLFEIFGPIMIGPSSSHTAGVARIAWLTGSMFAIEPREVVISFYGSLAATYRGHGSDNAVYAGLLGILPWDEKLSSGTKILKDLQSKGQGFKASIIAMDEMPPSWHPNTVVLELKNDSKSLKIRAASIGGGSININEINGYQVNLSGELEALLVLHKDEVGVIASVSHALASENINIAATSSVRKEKGKDALLVVEIDGTFPQKVIANVESLPSIIEVLKVPSMGND